MENFVRYAIYYSPEPGPFADATAQWLGWDAAAGCDVAQPDLAGLPRPASEITQTPRRYGFHATLKPPFRLASTRAALAADIEALAAELAPVSLPGLALHQLGSFLALTPEGDQSALSELAARVVRGLDHHRRPTSAEELEKRRANGLTPRQDALLRDWGYPYVMDEFRFHLTLSGKLPAEEVRQLAAVLEPVLAPVLPRPFVVRELCLFGEAPDRRFHLLHRYALSG